MTAQEIFDRIDFLDPGSISRGLGRMFARAEMLERENADLRERLAESRANEAGVFVPDDVLDEVGREVPR